MYSLHFFSQYSIHSNANLFCFEYIEGILSPMAFYNYSYTNSINVTFLKELLYCINIILSIMAVDNRLFLKNTVLDK